MLPAFWKQRHCPKLTYISLKILNIWSNILTCRKTTCRVMLILRQPLISALLVVVACNVYAISSTTHARIIKQPVYRITWIENNSRIDYRSVCLSYGFGTVKYRGCRAQAKIYFVSQCKNLTANNASERQRSKFCHASSQFNPIST